MPVVTDPSGAVTVRIPRERVERARATHRSVIRTFFIVFAILAAVVVGAGVVLAPDGGASLPGVLAIGAVFLVVPFLVRAWILRIQERGERHLASDGETLLRLQPGVLAVGDVSIPLDQVTFVYGRTAEETYASRSVGGSGRGLRQRLYRDGALSTISLAIGVERAAALNAPVGFIDPLRALPKTGTDPGRIDVAFGAYLDRDDFAAFWPAVETAAAEHFPARVVTGDVAWATATTSAAGTREQIAKDAEKL